MLDIPEIPPKLFATSKPTFNEGRGRTAGGLGRGMWVEPALTRVTLPSGVKSDRNRAHSPPQEEGGLLFAFGLTGGRDQGVHGPHPNAPSPTAWAHCSLTPHLPP